MSLDKIVLKRIWLFDRLTDFIPEDVVFNEIAPFIVKTGSLEEPCYNYFISDSLDEYYDIKKNFRFEYILYSKKNGQHHGFSRYYSNDVSVFDYPDSEEWTPSEEYKRTGFYLETVRVFENDKLSGPKIVYWANGLLRSYTEYVHNSAVGMQYLFALDSKQEYPESVRVYHGAKDSMTIDLTSTFIDTCQLFIFTRSYLTNYINERIKNLEEAFSREKKIKL